jgi:hypothetical protein
MNTIDTYFPYAEYRPGQRRMLEVAATVARDGGRVRREMKEGGIADAIIYATALRHRAKVVDRGPAFPRDAGGYSDGGGVTVRSFTDGCGLLPLSPVGAFFELYTMIPGIWSAMEIIAHPHLHGIFRHSPNGTHEVVFSDVTAPVAGQICE